MVNKQLSDWIRNQQLKGYSSSQILDHLVKHGYNANDVKEAMSVHITAPHASVSNRSSIQKKKRISILIIVLIIITILIIITEAIFFVVSNSYNASDFNTLFNFNKFNSSAPSSNNISSSANIINTTNTNIFSKSKLNFGCKEFSANLMSCTKYKCTFTHPLTNDNLTREILGIFNGKCNYIEQIPFNDTMECKYNETTRKLVAEYYSKLLNAKTVSYSFNVSSSGAESKTYIDGKEIYNPMQEQAIVEQCDFITNGIKLICPEGEKLLGSMENEDTNGVITTVPLCSDSKLDADCPICDNCASGRQQKTLNDSNIKQCVECVFNGCKTNYHCFNNKCISNEVLINITEPCDETCELQVCENCIQGHKICKFEELDNTGISGKCVECFGTSWHNSCATGYSCELYKCVANK